MQQSEQEQQKEQVIAQNEIPDLIINPYEVVNNSKKQIDYDKLIQSFGCQRIEQTHLDRIQALTQKPVHHYLRRGIFFSHRDLNQVLDAYEAGKGFYLYTGRGPSGESMHVGHLMPFIFTKYLQEAFDVPVVIELSDDEKFFHKSETTLEEYQRYGYENAKDIIACGFDVNKTFIFLSSQYAGHMYHNICKFQHAITYSQLRGIFGLNESDNCGKVAYPAVQAAPSLSSSFKHIFGKDEVMCLVPQGIDQDPYFRMTRDVCYKLKVPKTGCIHSQFLPGLHGFGTKMGTTDPTSAIFLTDTAKEIEEKIKKHALSGGGMTKKEHQEKGADLTVDVPYHYLRFFLEDDARLEEIRVQYGKGVMMTSEVKKELINVITKIVTEHQQRRALVTDEIVQKFMELRPLSNYPPKKNN
ncbi:unnamed protein product [Paramecium octaurelia]|uniref:Tryptophanyl-tRNA synthetase n=1 Tax=Paramecium octaurelia TaxID=43137 RepID=A0A8S1S405_PAROT|nr:unnamed protein product [Paramecium octaurelia]